MSGLAIGVSTVFAAVVSSLVLRRGERLHRPKFQPENGAFSIWGVIFSYGIVYAAGVQLNAIPADAMDACGSLVWDPCLGRWGLPGNSWTSFHERRERHVEALAGALGCLARKLQIPFVMVGCTQLDVTTLMDPAKQDWHELYPFEIVKLWIAAERAVAQRVARRQRVQGVAPEHRLHFLEPSRLAQACPGVRCDGMHFGADYVHVTGCSHTMPLWHTHVWDFLNSSELALPACEREAPKPRHCHEPPCAEAASSGLSLGGLVECLRGVQRY